MSIWNSAGWAAAIAGGLAVIYGLHRLCLWLEERGWLYYKHEKPESSPAGCFVALQKAVEPTTQHVLQIREEKRHQTQDDGQKFDRNRYLKLPSLDSNEE